MAVSKTPSHQWATPHSNRFRRTFLLFIQKCLGWIRTKERTSMLWSKLTAAEKRVHQDCQRNDDTLVLFCWHEFFLFLLCRQNCEELFLILLFFPFLCSVEQQCFSSHTARTVQRESCKRNNAERECERGISRTLCISNGLLPLLADTVGLEFTPVIRSLNAMP